MANSVQIVHSLMSNLHLYCLSGLSVHMSIYLGLVLYAVCEYLSMCYNRNNLCLYMS